MNFYEIQALPLEETVWSVDFDPLNGFEPWSEKHGVSGGCDSLEAQ